jgi:hypothetical protein
MRAGFNRRYEGQQVHRPREDQDAQGNWRERVYSINAYATAGRRSTCHQTTSKGIRLETAGVE